MLEIRLSSLNINLFIIFFKKSKKKPAIYFLFFPSQFT